MELLRPPDEYELDFAIGTTYTLDLLTALTAPVGFTLLELQSKRGVPDNATDKLTLLRTIREFANRMVIFCQAGAIAVPADHQPLFAYLEDTVVEVKAPRTGGIFHAKMWILRFRPASGNDAEIRYRLIVPSRNLTFDRSWDTVLTLDGTFEAGRKVGYAENRGLDVLIREYSKQATRDIPVHAAEKVRTIESEIRRVYWELPAGFESIRFWPLGIPGQPAWPLKGKIDRLLVVSPFLTQDFFKKVEKETDATRILVSQDEALQRFSAKALEPFDEVYSIVPEARRSDASESPSLTPDGCNGGLHAKLYVADGGWYATVWTGSANATKAGFGLNVELLVELTGPKSRCGVDAILNGDGESSLRSLLTPFSPKEPELDEDAEALECDVEAVQSEIALQTWLVRVGDAADDLYRLTLERSERSTISVPENVTLRCWPISLNRETASREPSRDSSVATAFEPCSLEAITPFIAFEATAERNGKTLSKAFVIRAALTGEPQNRREVILAALLADKSNFLRLLLLLLHDEDTLATPDGSRDGDLGEGSGRWTSGSSGLLEALMRALDRDPARLDHLRGLVQELRSTAEGSAVIPREFDALWSAVWQAREALREKA